MIKTERLLLRPYRAGDGDAYFAAALNNRNHLSIFESDNPINGLQSVEDAERLVQQFAADFEARKAFFFGGWDLATGAFVVQIYVGVVDSDLPEYEIGYFVDQAHEGQGYVTEAARAAIDFCFTRLNAHRLSIRCSDGNARSQRVAERCGFTLEGHLREDNPNLRRDDGTPTGTYIYGLLRSEYTTR